MSKKDTYYFSHDYNSRNDQKIKKLLVKHGMLGYGIFWAIVEDLYNNTNVLQTNYESIAYELRVNENIVKSIINDFDLFVIDGENFGSSSIERRLEERNQKSIKARESVNTRWKKIRSQYDSNTTVSKSDTIKESKVKEKKVKESKENDIYSTFVEEYFKFFENRNGVKPKFTALDGTKMKSIIKYLTSIATDQTEEGALQGWIYILTNWDKLPEFERKGIDLKMIDSNINRIINCFKSEQGKRKDGKQNIMAIQPEIDRWIRETYGDS